MDSSSPEAGGCFFLGGGREKIPPKKRRSSQEMFMPIFLMFLLNEFLEGVFDVFSDDALVLEVGKFSSSCALPTMTFVSYIHHHFQ